MASYGKSNKAARRLPEGAKEVLQEFVVDVLRKKVEKEKFVTFASEWFRSRMQKDSNLLSAGGLPITPSNIGGGNWGGPSNDPSTVQFGNDANTQEADVWPKVPTENEDAGSDPTYMAPVPEPTWMQPGENGQNAMDTENGQSSWQLGVDQLNVDLQVPSAVSLAPTEAGGWAGGELKADQETAQPESSMDVSNQQAPPPEVQEDPNNSPSRRQGVSAESYDPSAPPDESAPVKSFPKSDEQLSQVKDAVKEVLLFRSLDDDQLNKVIDALEEFPVEQGTDVIKFGDETAEHFYIIASGQFDCYVPVNGVMTKVLQYDNKGSFGELALMYNQPRAATVTATSEGKLWRLDRETFRRIVLRGAFQKRELYKKLMDQVDFLADLQPYEKENICDALQAKTYNADEVVMRQGEIGDGMYFVEAGEVICARAENNEEEKEIARVGPGQYVGELALIAGQPRAATVKAAVDGTKLAFLDAKAFERLMGPCVDILKKNVDRYKDKIVAVFGENSNFLTVN